MNQKRTLISIAMAATVLVSLFAMVSSAASVSGQTMAGTGPAVASSNAQPPFPTGYNEYANYFAVDTSGTLWHTNGSGNWDSLGGVSTSSPAAVSWDSSYLRLDVFVRGSDGGLWWKYYQNGWSTWHSLGGQLAAGTGPAVASWSAGRLDVFVEGTNGALYHKWYSGGAWSSWQNLGGKLTASPAATFDMSVPYPPANNIWVFVRGTDGAVWQKVWNGTASAWSTWSSLGGQVAPNTGPAVSQTLVLFVQGTDHQLWHRNHGGSWSSWATLGGKPSEPLSTASPSAVTNPDLHTTVCVSTTSGNLWYSENDVTGLWPQYTWSSISGPP